MRERAFLREKQRETKLKQLRQMQQKQAEKDLTGALFRLARMLAMHRVIEALFGNKK